MKFCGYYVHENTMKCEKY